MGRPCSSCKSPNAQEIDRKIKSGTTLRDISRWLREIDNPITPTSLGKHAREHVGVERPPGRRPITGDFLETVRDQVHEDVLEGKLRLTVRDGLSAQSLLDARQKRDSDKDLMVKIAMVLTGRVEGYLPAPDPEMAAIEAEFRPLLTPGIDNTP